MFSFKKPRPHKPQDRFIEFPPNTQNDPVFGATPPDFDLRFGAIPPNFDSGSTTVVIGADGDIPPEELEKVLQAFSSIPPGLIEQMLGQMIHGLDGASASFGFEEFPKSPIIELEEGNYSVISDPNDPK